MGLSVTRTIAAPPDKVFAALSDFEHAAETIRGITKIEMLTDGPVGLGTRFRESRIMFNREATEEMEVTAWNQGRSYTLGCESCGARYASSFIVEPTSGGSRVTMKMEVKPLTLMAKLMSPLGSLMSGSIKRCVEHDIDDVKAKLEQGQTA